MVANTTWSDARRRGEYTIDWVQANRDGLHKHTIYKRGQKGGKRRNGKILTSAVNVTASNRALEVCSDFGCRAARDYEAMTTNERKAFSRMYSAWQSARREFGEEAANALWSRHDQQKRWYRAYETRKSVRNLAEARLIAENVKTSIEVMPDCPRCGAAMWWGYPFELFCVYCGHVHYVDMSDEEKKAQRMLFLHARAMERILRDRPFGVWHKRTTKMMVYYIIREQLRTLQQRRTGFVAT